MVSVRVALEAQRRREELLLATIRRAVEELPDADEIRAAIDDAVLAAEKDWRRRYA